jgi:hypothetical protein
MSSLALVGHGISVRLPPGWEGRIAVRGTAEVAAVGAGHVAAAGASGPVGAATGVTRPVVHLANFALPAERGDFGSGAVDVMGSRNVLLVLFEYGPESVGTALFRGRGMPRPQPHQFRPEALQRRIPGQLGYQRFFTEAGRALCLYAVLGSAQYVPNMTAEARTVLAATEIAPR